MRARQMRAETTELQGETTEDGKVDRRAVFGGLIAAAAFGSGTASSNPYRDVNVAAEALASSMQVAHGGTWVVHVDHEVGVVAVFRDCS